MKGAEAPSPTRQAPQGSIEPHPAEQAAMQRIYEPLEIPKHHPQQLHIRGLVALSVLGGRVIR